MKTNLLTKKEKAEELKITIRTLDRKIKKGEIDVIHITRSKKKWFLPARVDENI